LTTEDDGGLLPLRNNLEVEAFLMNKDHMADTQPTLVGILPPAIDVSLVANILLASDSPGQTQGQGFQPLHDAWASLPPPNRARLH